MKYALLIYATPGAAEGVQPADDGVINSWLDYTAALKESGALLAAEQLGHVETATSVTLHGSERLLPIVRYGTVEVRPVLEGQAWRAPLE